MGWLRKVFGPKGKAAPAPPEHAVIVTFAYGSTDLQRLFELEDQLEQAITAAQAGEYDGNEVAVDGSEAILYMYGPDADALWEAIQPVLMASPWVTTGTAVLRYGPPEDGVPQRSIKLES